MLIRWNQLWNKKAFTYEKKVVFIIIIAILLLIGVGYFYYDLYQLYNHENYLAIHTLLEFFIVQVSLLIAIKGWIILPYNRSSRRLLISTLFLAIGLLFLLHALTYEGMPFFITTSSIAKSIWFSKIASITESIGLLWILSRNNYRIKKARRVIPFSLSFLYFVLISILIFVFESFLPPLYISGQGVTLLKIGIDYFIIPINIATIIIVFNSYKNGKNKSDLSLMASLFFILLSGFTFTIFHQVNDLYHFLAHVYKFIAYYYLLKALYIDSFQEPFKQKKQAEQNSMKSEQQLRWALNHIPGGFIAIDKQLEVTLINPTAKMLFEKDLGLTNLLGQNYLNLLKSRGIGEEKSHLIMAIKEKKISDKEKMRLFDNVFLNDAAPIIDPQSQEVLGAVNYFIDITEEELEKKKREQLLVKYLNQSKNLERLIDAIPVMFLAIDQEGKIIATNEKMSLGLIQVSSQSEFIGKHFDFICDYFDMKFDESALYRALQGEEVRNIHIKVKECNFLVNAYPIYCTEKKEVFGAIALYQDITELEILRNEMENLERLNLVGQMAASITHEIRNPMATIRGFVQLLQQQKKKPSQSYYKIIIDELDRANSIISDFLSLSKNRIVEMQEYNLNDIISELYPIILAEANIQGQFVDIDLDNALQNVKLNKREIIQMILNLVRNAFEAMEKGGRLTLITKKEDGKVHLFIKDTGIGISKEILDKLFQPFFTTKEGGTGLGLAVTKSVIEKHHAQMEIESVEGSGTTFIVIFKPIM